MNQPAIVNIVINIGERELTLTLDEWADLCELVKETLEEDEVSPEPLSGMVEQEDNRNRKIIEDWLEDIKDGERDHPSIPECPWGVPITPEPYPTYPNYP